MDFVCVSKGIRKPAATPKCCSIFPATPDYGTQRPYGGVGAPISQAAGAQHNIDETCQPRSGTLRSDAQPAPTWEYVDSDIALRRGLGYLHARDGFDTRGLPATSTALVDRPASDPSSTSATERGFWSDDDNDKTVEMTTPDVENVQPHDDETQRLTTQLIPADAVASSEARLTTRDFCHERLAGPYSPDSYSLPRLLEGATATVPPAFLFARKKMTHKLMIGAPADAIGIATDSGWMTSVAFVSYLQHVVKHVKPTKAIQFS